MWADEDDQYDEDAALFAQVFNDPSRYLTDLEIEAHDWLKKLDFMANADPIRSEELHEEWGDPRLELDALIAGGRDKYFRIVCQRLLDAELVGETTIGRCPECLRIIRSFKARQCLWCGHDWH